MDKTETGGFAMRSTFKAVAYARASKEDADSETIGNQIELIRDYISSAPEISLVGVRADNGYSGIDFLRPAFSAMMRDIEAGKADCIIIKDLSRLGRNYIEVGELIDNILPRCNVRLIAINDRFDSLNPRSEADEILIPFKNLINEQYLRDFSVKIRSNLNVKRKNGEFVSAFAPYGYMRGENDRHKLVADEHAAEVVRAIFRLKIAGMSQRRIAEWLNETGEPSPSEYKRRTTNYSAHFQRHARASWSAAAVGRILRNCVYTGTLAQGKSASPSYKVKKRVLKPADEWDIIPNNHEAIVSANEFGLVNDLLRRDTRTAPGMDTVYPLSGLIFCGDCGNNLIRKNVGRYAYYVCATNKSGQGCMAHYTNRTTLDAAVLEAVRAQAAHIMDAEGVPPYPRQNIVKLNKRIEDRENELVSCEKYKQSLREDYTNGIISRGDYIEFSRDYAERIEDLRLAIAKLRQEEELEHMRAEDSGCCRNISGLTRELAVSLIDRIDVFSGKRIAIRFRYSDTPEAARDIPGGLADAESGRP